MIDVNNQKDSVSLLPLSTKKKKGKSQTVTPTLPKPQGLKASGAPLRRETSLSPKRHLLRPRQHPPQSQRRILSNPTQDFNEGTAKTTLHHKGSLGDKDSG
nr:hypothetical protein [Tanacetum cinerariifolium]